MQHIDENKISTKKFLQNFFGFIQVLGRNWRLLMLGLLLGACFSLIKDISSEQVNNFRATIIFKLEVESGGGMGDLGGLGSLMGVGGANMGGGDLFSGQNFPAIVQSQTVYERALMSTVMVDSTEMLLINYVIDSSDIKSKEWAGSLFRKPFVEAMDFKFEKKKPEDFTPLENLIMRDVYGKLKEATSIYPMEESTMIVLSSLITNEKLAKTWVSVLLNSVQDFYVEVKTSKTRKLLGVQENRLDSLANLLYSTDRRLARITFDQPNVVDPSAAVKQAQVSRSNTFLTNQYLTQLMTIESLNRTIMEQTPLFLKVEETRLPLEQESTQTGMNLKLSSLAGLLIMLIVVIARGTYKDIMNS